jgi:hypothetical protein
MDQEITIAEPLEGFGPPPPLETQEPIGLGLPPKLQGMVPNYDNYTRGILSSDSEAEQKFNDLIDSTVEKKIKKLN